MLPVRDAVAGADKPGTGQGKVPLVVTGVPLNRRRSPAILLFLFHDKG